MGGYQGPKFVTWMDQLTAEERAEVKAEVCDKKGKSLFDCLLRKRKQKGHIRSRLSMGDEKKRNVEVKSDGE